MKAATLKIRGGTDVDRFGKRAGKGALIQWEMSGTLGVSQDQTLFVWDEGGSKAEGSWTGTHRMQEPSDLSGNEVPRSEQPSFRQSSCANILVLNDQGGGEWPDDSPRK